MPPLSPCPRHRRVPKGCHRTRLLAQPLQLFQLALHLRHDLVALARVLQPVEGVNWHQDLGCAAQHGQLSNCGGCLPRRRMRPPRAAPPTPPDAARRRPTSVSSSLSHSLSHSATPSLSRFRVASISAGRRQAGEQWTHGRTAAAASRRLRAPRRLPALQGPRIVALTRLQLAQLRHGRRSPLGACASRRARAAKSTPGWLLGATIIAG